MSKPIKNLEEEIKILEATLKNHPRGSIGKACRAVIEEKKEMIKKLKLK